MSDTIKSPNRAFREARLQKGLTLAEVARQIGVSRQAVSQWESGETSPTHEKIAQLEAILGQKTFDDATRERWNRGVPAYVDDVVRVLAEVGEPITVIQLAKLIDVSEAVARYRLHGCAIHGKVRRVSWMHWSLP